MVGVEVEVLWEELCTCAVLEAGGLGGNALGLLGYARLFLVGWPAGLVHSSYAFLRLFIFKMFENSSGHPG